MKNTASAVVLGLFALSALALTATGCASNSGDEDTGASITDSSEDALASSSPNFGYFTARLDMRKCAAPKCGGYFVKRVNQAKTTCADGTLADECLVKSITFGALDLSDREESELRSNLDAGKTVLRARVYKTTIAGATYGTLKANEAWVGASGSPADGNFYRAADNGIRCIKAPCPSQTAYTLNSHEQHNIIDAVFTQTATPAPADLLQLAQDALWTKDGTLVAGGIQLPKCVSTNNNNCGPKVVASEFYVRVQHREGQICGGRSQGSCGIGQYCSWAPKDICGAADASGKCAYKAEICTMLYKPVCGCDGKTYSNACVASSNGASVSSDGACQN